MYYFLFSLVLIALKTATDQNNIDLSCLNAVKIFSEWLDMDLFP